jgi:hypothetical protein
LFGGLDSCNAGDRQNIAFWGFALAEELDGCGCATDFALRYRTTVLE